MMIFDISIAAACTLNYDDKEDYQKIVCPFLVVHYYEVEGDDNNGYGS